MQTIFRSTRALIAAGLAVLFSSAGAASAVPIASAAITGSQSGSIYTYSLTLTDAPNSPSPIGTYWFAWVPGKDFLTTSPASVINPTGWSDAITHGGATDGYAIQWVSSTNAVPAGGNQIFSFTTIDPPSTVFGNSSFFPTFPTTTSFAYSGAPFSDAGEQFTASGVPEPTSLAILTPALLMLGRRRRSKTA